MQCRSSCRMGPGSPGTAKCWQCRPGFARTKAGILASTLRSEMLMYRSSELGIRQSAKRLVNGFRRAARSLAAKRDHCVAHLRAVQTAQLVAESIRRDTDDKAEIIRDERLREKSLDS